MQVCGRAISVYHKALSGWLEGRVTQFDPELSLHLVEYDCTEGQEIAPEWLRLCSERPWQWLDERASDAEPNPTSVGRVFDESVSASKQCNLAVMMTKEPGLWEGRRTCRWPTSKPCMHFAEAVSVVFGAGCTSLQECHEAQNACLEAKSSPASNLSAMSGSGPLVKGRLGASAAAQRRILSCNDVAPTLPTLARTPLPSSGGSSAAA